MRESLFEKKNPTLQHRPSKAGDCTEIAKTVEAKSNYDENAQGVDMRNWPKLMKRGHRIRIPQFLESAQSHQPGVLTPLEAVLFLCLVYVAKR